MQPKYLNHVQNIDLLYNEINCYSSKNKTTLTKVFTKYVNPLIASKFVINDRTYFFYHIYMYNNIL